MILRTTNFKRAQSFLLILTLSSTMPYAYAAKPATKKLKTPTSYKAWQIVQRHEIYGPQKVYLTKNWLVADNIREGTTYVKRLNNPKILIYNPKKSVYYKGTCANVMKRMHLFTSLLGPELSKVKGSHRKWKLSKKVKLLGLPTEIYSLYYKNKTWKIWITKSLNIKQAVYKDYLDWSKLPELNGMPLRLVMYSTGTKSTTILNTSSVSKTTVPQSKLRLTKKYKRVNEIFQVSSGRTEQLMESFSEILGE